MEKQDIFTGQTIYYKPTVGAKVQDNAWYKVVKVDADNITLEPQYGQTPANQPNKKITMPLSRILAEFQLEKPWLSKPVVKETPKPEQVQPKKEKIKMDQPIEQPKEQTDDKGAE
jgi:TfoX/Sxy family transcriptional regulator of competence genes